MLKTQEKRVEKKSFIHPSSQLWDATYQTFSRFLFFTTLFHLFFILLIFSELFFSICYFYLYSDPTILAFAFGGGTLTLFTYFSIKIYLSLKKTEKIDVLCQSYFDFMKKKMNYQSGIFEHHIQLAKAIHAFSAALDDQEYTFFPSYFAFLNHTIETFSCFLYWKDFFIFKERLLQEAIDEYLKLVLLEPTSLEVHAALANAYVLLSALFGDPRKSQTYDDEKWIPYQRFTQEMQQRFRNCAKKAIEEFKILNDYAPEEPWVHYQLAYSYHDLQMPEKEIDEYEKILTLQPENEETLFKLGMLYFEQGNTAKGLHIYETLKRMNPSSAERLIHFYGSEEVSKL